jgi:hypothetical protein
VNSNVGWVFNASIHVTHYKLLGKHMREKTTFVYRICNSGFKKISKETIKKLDKEFKSTKNSHFANPLSCHRKPIHVQPSTFVEWDFGHCTLKVQRFSWMLPIFYLWSAAESLPPFSPLWKLQGSSSLICLLCTKVKEENVPSVASSRDLSSVHKKWRKKMCLQWHELEICLLCTKSERRKCAFSGMN